MLHATYKASPYIFYISTEDRRYNTTVPTSQIRFLFKFTNDMDGRVVYAYGQDQVVYDRYTKVTFSHNTTEDIFLGIVNFVPNGYWNYVVYEVAADTSIASLTCATVPSSATDILGYYTITSPSGAITTTDFTAGVDVYEQSLTDLDAGDYVIKIYDGCGALVTIVNNGFRIHTFTAQADNTRWIEIKNTTQTATGITFDVVSNAPIGHSYDFVQGVSPASQITNITSKPQTTSHSFTQDGLSYSGLNVIEMELYTLTGGSGGGGGLVWGPDTMNTVSVKRPADGYGFGAAIVCQPVSVDGTGTVLSKGSAEICVINGTVQASSSRGYYVLQGVVEEGKLYIKEPVGEEQVQYTQHPEPSGTNYIWYGQ